VIEGPGKQHLSIAIGKTTFPWGLVLRGGESGASAGLDNHWTPQKKKKKEKKKKEKKKKKKKTTLATLTFIKVVPPYSLLRAISPIQRTFFLVQGAWVTRRRDPRRASCGLGHFNSRPQNFGSGVGLAQKKPADRTRDNSRWGAPKVFFF